VLWVCAEWTWWRRPRKKTEEEEEEEVEPMQLIINPLITGVINKSTLVALVLILPPRTTDFKPQ
jgi:hypothetical protein